MILLITYLEKFRIDRFGRTTTDKLPYPALTVSHGIDEATMREVCLPQEPLNSITYKDKVKLGGEYYLL